MFAYGKKPRFSPASFRRHRVRERNETTKWIRSFTKIPWDSHTAPGAVIRRAKCVDSRAGGSEAASGYRRGGIDKPGPETGVRSAASECAVRSPRAYAKRAESVTSVTTVTPKSLGISYEVTEVPDVTVYSSLAGEQRKKNEVAGLVTGDRSLL